MWKRNQLHLLTVATTLSSAAFCLHVAHPEPQERLTRHGTLFTGDKTEYFPRETPEETGGYQADQTEAEVRYQLAELKLQKLRPSVRCENDSMILRMLGKQIPDILVERDGNSPVPLSEMPAHCGLSVKRARRDVFLVAKYDGCHMTQEGDNYILPLRLWGMPVKMGCPVEALLLTVSCTLSAMVIQVSFSMDSLKLKVNGEWQPLAQACDTCGFTLEAVPNEWVVTAPYTSKCWQIEGVERLLPVMYSDRELNLSCPLHITPLPADEELPPVPPFPPVDYPFPYAEHQFWPFYLGYPGTPPRSPTSAPTTAATTTATSSTIAATTVKHPSADEHFWNPFGNDRLFYPGYSGLPTHASTTTNPSTAARTVQPSSADEHFWNPYWRDGHWFIYSGHPGYSGPPPSSPNFTPTIPAPASTTAATITSMSTAATTVKPPSAGELFWNPYGHPKHWPYYPSYQGAYDYPSAPPKKSTATVMNPAPTSTTTATTAKPYGADEHFWNPYGHAKQWRFYPGYLSAHPKIPTSTTTTTATTPPTLPTSSSSVYSNAGQEHQMPWMPYPQRNAGGDQKGLLPVASASVVNGIGSVKQMYPWQKWYFPSNQMPGIPQLQMAGNPSAATRYEHHQGMPQPYLWPMYHSPAIQSIRNFGFDPKLTFDQMFASRGWSSLLYPAQLSPLQVKAIPGHEGGDLVPRPKN